MNIDLKGLLMNVVLPAATPALADLVDEGVDAVHNFAEETPNGWDNVGAFLVCQLANNPPTGFETLSAYHGHVSQRVKETEDWTDDMAWKAISFMLGYW